MRNRRQAAADASIPYKMYSTLYKQKRQVFYKGTQKLVLRQKKSHGASPCDFHKANGLGIVGAAKPLRRKQGDRSNVAVAEPKRARQRKCSRKARPQSGSPKLLSAHCYLLTSNLFHLFCSGVNR